MKRTIRLVGLIVLFCATAAFTADYSASYNAGEGGFLYGLSASEVHEVGNTVYYRESVTVTLIKKENANDFPQYYVVLKQDESVSVSKKSNTGLGVFSYTFTISSSSAVHVTVNGYYDAVASGIVGDHSKGSFDKYFKRDNTPPSASLSVDTTGPTSGTVTISLVNVTDNLCGVDPKSYSYSIDDNGNEVDDDAIYRGKSVTVSENCCVWLRVSDNLGNECIKPYKVTNIDTTRPVITTPFQVTPSDWTNGDVTITASASDSGGSGINADGFEYSLDGMHNWQNGRSVTVSANGIVYFRVKDNAGNVSTYQSCTVTNIDTTPPFINITPNTLEWRNDSVTLIAAGTDSGGSGIDDETYEYKIGTGGRWIPGSTAIVESNRTVWFRVKDKVGNLSPEFSHTVENIDKTFPVITSISQSPSGFTNGSVTVTAAAQDNGDGSGIEQDSWQHRVGTGSWTAGASATVWSNCTVEFLVRDKAGNYSAAATEIVGSIDTSKPTVHISPNVTAPTNGNVILTAAGIDAGVSGIQDGTYEYRFGTGVSWIQGSVAVVESNRTVWFRVMDKAGNLSDEAVYEVKNIDKTSPVITSITRSPSGFTNKNVTVTAQGTDTGGSGIDNGSWRHKVGNGNWAAGESVTVDSNCTVSFLVSDKAGNISAETVQTVANVDKEKPIITVTPSTAAWTSEHVALTVTASDTASGVKAGTLEYRVGDAGQWRSVWDGTIPENAETVVKTILIQGNEKINFRVSDVVGNEESVSYTVENIDKAKPTLSVTADPTDMTNGSVALTVTARDAASGLKGGTLEYRIGEAGQWSSGWDETVSEKTDSITKKVLVHDNETFFFRVFDNVGNESEKTSYRVENIDKIKPTIQISADPSGWTNGSVTVAAEANDRGGSGVEHGSWEYRIGTGGWTAGSTVTVESNCVVVFRVSDRGGNVSDETVFELDTIDTTNPVLLQDEIATGRWNDPDGNGAIDNGETTVFAEGEYIPSRSLYCSISGAADTGSGIDYYRYTVNERPLDELGLNSRVAHGAPQVNFPLIVPSGGTYYLHLQAVDLAGNGSEIVHLRLEVDPDLPPVPRIVGMNQIDARINGIPDTTVTSANSGAVFRVSSESTRSGIAGYGFVLKIGTSEQTADEYPGGSGVIGIGEPLMIPDLPDNRPGEFYFLSVNTISKNGMSGGSAVFVFRIDTDPPRDLAVRSSLSVTGWNANDAASFYWTKPTDFTGVKNYYYLAVPLSGNTGTTVLRENGVIRPEYRETVFSAHSVEGWRVLANSGSEGGAVNGINLAALCDSDTSDTIAPAFGTVCFAVCAEDYSGNVKYDECVVSFDTGKPVIDSLSVPPDGVDGPAHAVTITWDQPTDNCAVPDELLIGITLVDTGTDPVDTSDDIVSIGPYFRPGNTLSETFTGLKPGTTYEARVTVYDTAVPIGNSRSSAVRFNLETPVAIPVTRVPFEDVVKGSRVYGIRDESDIDASTVVLDLPATLGMMTGTPPSHVLEEVAFDTFVFSGEDFSTGRNEDVPYALTLNGFPVTGSGLALSRTDGLSFSALSYNSFTYPNVGIVSSTDTRFLPVAAPVSGPSYRYQHTDNPNGPEGWLVKDITSTGFDNDSWMLWNGTIDFTDSSSRITAYTLTEGGVKNFDVPVKSVAVAPDGRIRGGLFAAAEGELYLDLGNTTTGGATLRLMNAQFGTDCIEVSKALLVLSDGFGPTDSDNVPIPAVYFENFSIDRNGFVTEGRTYVTTDFYLYDPVNAFRYHVEELRLTAGGIFAHGSVEFGTYSEQQGFVCRAVPDGLSQIVPFSGLELTNSGLSAGYDAKLPDLALVLCGFPVNLRNCFMTEAGITVGEAAVDLGTLKAGFTTSLSGLVLNAYDLSIRTPGTSSVTFEFSFTDYGHDSASPSTSVTGLRLGPDKLYAPKASIALPSSLGGGSACIQDLPLIAGVSYGRCESTPFSNAVLTLTAAGFPAVGKNARFDGDCVYVPELELLLPEGAAPSTIVYTDVRADFFSVSFPRPAAEVVYVKDGWNLTLRDLSVTADHLAADCVLTLPLAFAGYQIAFPGFELYPDGTYESGTTPVSDDRAFTLWVHGWSMKAVSVSLAADGTGIGKLKIGTGSIPLYASMGTGAIVFTDLELGSDGTIVSGGVCTKAPSFLAGNRFFVEPTDFRILPDRLAAKGTVFFHPALGSESRAQYSGYDITLNQDGTIATPVSETPVPYSIAGFDVIATKYSIDRSGLWVGESVVPLADGMTLSLPSLHFYPDGSIATNRHRFDEFQHISLFGLSFRITQVRLVDCGLSIEAFVSLPSKLGGASIYFENLVISRDGGTLSVTSDAAVPYFSFSAFDALFEFADIRLESGNFSLGELCVTLPPKLESRQIRVLDVSLDSSGNFGLGSVSIDPFELYGYIVTLEDFSFEDNTIRLKGQVTFPRDFMIRELASQSVLIKRFEYRIGAELPVFDAALSGLMFELKDGFFVTAEELGIRNDGFYIGSAELYFPEQWLANISVEKVGVSGISYIASTHAFGIDEIYGRNIEMTCDSYTFTITSISYSADEGFVFGGAFPLPDLFNPESDPPILTVSRLQITPGMRIGDLIASVENLSIPFNENVTFIGSAYASKDDAIGSFVIGLSGSFLLNDSFPVSDFKNTALRIDGFSYDLIARKLIKVDAGYKVPDDVPSDVFGLTVYGLELGIRYDETDPALEITAGGEILLASEVPVVGGERFGLHVTMDALGGNFSLSSSITTSTERALYGDLLLKRGARFAVETETDSSGSVSGLYLSVSEASLYFGPGFAVERFRGSTIMIESFSLTTDGAIRDLDLKYLFPNPFRISEELTLKDGALSFEKAPNGRDIVMALGGKLCLPESIGKIEIEIATLKITTSGEFIINTTATITDTKIFDALTIKTAGLSLVSGERGEIVFAIDNGSIAFPNAMLPKELKGKTFEIEKFTFSSKHGLTAFSAGLGGGEIEFELYDGIDLVFTSFTMGIDGFGTTVQIVFPPNYYGAKDLKVNGEFRMNWNGEFTKLEGTVEYVLLEIKNFKLDVHNLKIYPSGIRFEKAVLTLPRSLENQQIALKNAGIDKNGKFYGEFAVESLAFTFSGCRLEMIRPRFDPDSYDILFGKVVFMLPESLGGASFGVENVRIGASGLIIEGGSFNVPDFSVAGGLQFRNVFFEFKLSAGTYTIGGGGKVLVPGMGEVGAKIGLTTVTAEYPIGLKYAEFSFKTAGLGLPIGATGLYVNGMSGTLAFGPPGIEMPQELRDKFSAGMRIGFSVYMRDAAGTMTGEPGIWINCNSFDFAVFGYFQLLDGFIRSDIFASITKKYGFEAKLTVDISYEKKFGISGGARIHVWDQNGMKLCGEVWALVYIEKGALVLFDLPWESWQFGPLGIEFGNFKNNITGFKGYISNVPILGTVGVFIGSSGFDIGNVDKYVLLDRSRSAGDGGMRGSAREPDAPAVITLDGQPMYETRTYSFIDPNAGATPSAYGRTRAEDDTPPPTGVERVIFFVRHSRGNPVLTAVSPSGKRYIEGDENVNMERGEPGTIMAVITDEEGIWDLEVSAMAVDEEYTVEVCGVRKIPELAVETPRYLKEIVTDSVTVSGMVVHGAAERGIVTVYLAGEKGSYVGEPVGTAVPEPDGCFTCVVDTSSLADGEYFLYAGFEDGENPEAKAFAPGSIQVRHHEPLAAVRELVVSELDDRILVSFLDPNGKRSAGYTMYVIESSTGSVEEVFLGKLTRTEFSGLKAGSGYRISVVARDFYGAPGLSGEEVSFTFGMNSGSANSFSIADSEVTHSAALGESVNGTIEFTVHEPVRTGTAADYLDIEIKECPRWFFLTFDKERWELSNGSGTIGYTIMQVPSVREKVHEDDEALVDLPLVPGTYRVVFDIVNQGNRELRQTAAVIIDVVYPTPVVESVTPDLWNIKDQVELIIRGRNFLEGINAALDGTALQILSRSDYVMKAIVPALAEAGEHLLTLTGPDGKTASVTLDTIEPTYSVIQYKKETKLVPGGSGRFFFDIRGKNDFDGVGVFTVGEVPAGWSAVMTSPAAAEGDLAVLEVTAPANAAAGARTITVVSDKGHVLPLNVIVIQSEPDAHISSTTSGSVTVGEELCIFGYGFGKTGTVRLLGKPLTVLEWTTDMIRVVIPEDASSGSLTVERREGSDSVSNEIPIEVITESFVLYPGAARLSLQPGESRSVPVAVMGYADEVELEVTGVPGAVDAVFDTARVKPNGRAALTIHVDSGAQKKEYIVTIRGTSARVSKGARILLTVGEAFEFRTGQSLPSGAVGSAYSARIETGNGHDPVQFYAGAGALPSGLVLDREGYVSGTPMKPGVYEFSVEAVDVEQRSITRYFSITILEDGWSRNGHDEGRSSYNGIRSPADGSVVWKSDRHPGAAEVLVGGDRVFLIGTDRVTALDYMSGRVVFTFRSESGDQSHDSVVKAMLHGGTLYALTSDGVLSGIDAAFGSLVWSVRDVDAFTVCSGLLVSSGADGIAFRTPDTHEITAAYSGSLNGTLFSGGGELYRFQNDELQRFTEGRWKTRYRAGNTIADAAIDSSGIVLITESGRLTLLTSDGSVRNADTGISGRKLVLGPETIIVYGGSSINAYSRSGLERLWVYQGRFRSVVLADEKVFAAGEPLTVLNRFTGSTIWRSSDRFVCAVVARENLFALEESGALVRYGGADNIQPPETVITLDPPNADGRNGWYVTKPVLSLSAEDRESIPVTTEYRVGTGTWIRYSDPVTLPEGEHRIAAGSCDTQGYREPDKERVVKVDITAPVTNHTIRKTDGEAGYTVSEVLIALSGEDELSGLERIEYSVNGGTAWIYETPIRLAEEGLWSVRYHGLDTAGNRGEAAGLSFAIDLSDPTVISHVTSEPGLSVVYLKASDSFSGVNRIEYSIDSSATAVYQIPISVSGEGGHTIRYRSVDNAGRTSGWQTLVIDVEPSVPSRPIQDLRFTAYLPGRQIVRDVQAGEMMFGMEWNRENRIDNLPDYIAGADFIRLNLLDYRSSAEPLCSFTAGGDIVVYVMIHAASDASMDGWTLVEREYPVENERYFIGGAGIYCRWYDEGERVILPAADGVNSYPHLVFVKEKRTSGVRIMSPMPGTNLTPFDAVIPSGTDLTGAAVLQEWSYRIGDGRWTNFDPAARPLSIPYMQEPEEISIRLIMRDEYGSITGMHEEQYRIENHAGVEWVTPAPGTELFAGASVPVVMSVRNLNGDTVPLGAVSAEVSTDGVSWSGVELSEGVLPVPDAPGQYLVRLRYPENETITREETASFTVVYAYSPVSIEFGSALGGEFTLGEAYGHRHSGKLYGFTEQLEDRTGTFRYLDLSGAWPEIKTGSSIAFKRGVPFVYLSGNGRFRVEAKLAPIIMSDTRTVRVNGADSRVARTQTVTELSTVVKEVTVRDGRIVFEGGDELSVVRVTITRIEDTGTESDTSVTIPSDSPPRSEPPSGESGGGKEMPMISNEYGIWNEEWNY